MSFFSWFFSKPTPPLSTGLPPDGLTAPPQAPALPPTLADLKHQRHERREHLYSVVRSVMLRSEVLASLYKFKVLSLDTRGRQFLIMVDLLGEQALHPDRWGPVEQLMAMTAAQRHDLQVKAVYWRVTQVAETSAAPPAPVPAAVHQSAAATPAVTARPTRPAGGSKADGFDPIGQDEVMAFKRAIAAVTPEAPLTPETGQVLTSGPRHTVPPLTGYEDTQLLEPDDAASPLSRTQFGDL